MAKDVITRFKLETTAFDSAIKKASKELSDYSMTATKAKEGFNQFTKSNVEAARALGTMATSSNNAKGKVNELVGAYNDAAKAYNKLTKEQQQSDFGKAMAASLTQLQQRIRETKHEMEGLSDAMSKSGGGLFSGLGDKMSGALQVFGGNLMTMAAGKAMEFATELGDAVKQGIELAKAGEGVRIAFERLGRGDILDGLREATHGTVTDLELMKAAVKFNDFKLPVEELGTMLAFAQQKAKDTGQSVDYMVDSIVTGLGRKSLMILDNLGLSAAEIKDKMAETGDMTKAVGAIIREQMQKAGDYVETAADRAAQANVDLQNKLEELGRKFLPVQEASNQLWTSMKIGILDIVGGPLARLLNGLTEAGRLRNQMNDMAGGNSSSETEKQLNFLRKTSPANRQQRYNKQLGIYTQQENAAWREVNSLKGQREAFRKEALKRGARDDDWTVYADFDKRIAEAQRKAQAWQNFRADYIRGAKELIKPVEVDIKTDNAVKDVDSLRVKLAELEAQRKKAIKAGDQDLAKNLTKQITQTKSDIKALDPNALKTTTSHTLTKPEQADAKYVQAQKDYEQSLQQAALEVKAGTINSAEAKKKELQAAETLWKSIGDAREVYDSPKLKEAQANVEAKIVALGPEVEKAIEAQKESEKAARELANAQRKLTDAQNELADAQASGDLKKIYAAEKKVETAQVQVDARNGNGITSGVTVPVNLTMGNIEAFKGHIQEEMAKTNLADPMMKTLEENMSDATAISTIMQTAIQNGIDTAQFDTSGLMQKLLNGEDISDDTIQAYVDQLNNLLKEKFDETEWPQVAITFNVKSKEIENLSKSQQKDAQKMAKDWQAAGQAISAVGNAMNQIEDPAAKVMGTIAQAVASVALGAAQAIASPKPWPAWIAFAAAATATMVSTISTIHSATGFANGGIVPGNSFSGDNLHTADYGINSGELILNKAQQNSIASQLEDREEVGSSALPYVTGDMIVLGANNYLRGDGQGELVTTRFLRDRGII